MVHRLTRRVVLRLIWSSASVAIGCTHNGAGSSAESDPRNAICKRQCVESLLNQYLVALSKRDPTGLPLSPVVRITENGDVQSIGEGLWKTAGALGHYRITTIDPERQAGAVQTVISDGDNKVQLQVRLQVERGQITQIETLVARKGDTCCWALEKLDSLSSVYETVVPKSQRMTRDRLLAAADAYFTALHTAGTPQYQRTNVAGIRRYENGKLTTNVVGGNRIIRNDAQIQLDSGMFGRISVVNRRYPVVDVDHGTLLGIVVFEYPESKRRAEIISEMFKIEGGLIREIRAVQVGRPSTGWQ